MQNHIDWWRAQCIFRGLPHKGEWEEMQASLRSGRNVMIQPLSDLEKQLDAESKKKRELAEAEAERKADEWERGADEKAMQLLKSAFQLDDASTNKEKKAPNVVIIKKHLIGIPNAAKSLGLSCRFIEAPTWLAEDWAIVGKTLELMEAGIARIRKDADDRRKAEKKAKSETAIRKQALVAQQSEKPEGAWDVTGTWKITADNLSRPDGYSGDWYPTLKIFRLDGVDGSQLVGQFDFGGGNLDGLFRFLGPKGASRPAIDQNKQGTGQKRKRDGGHYLGTSVTSTELLSNAASPDDVNTSNSLLGALAKERMARMNNNTPQQRPAIPTTLVPERKKPRTKMYADPEPTQFRHKDNMSSHPEDEEYKTDSTFLFPRLEHVSAEKATWDFQYRAKQNGRYYDRYYGKTYSITFSGKGGTTLTGRLETECLEGEKCEFSGVKVDFVNEEDVMGAEGIEERWAYYKEWMRWG